MLLRALALVLCLTVPAFAAPPPTGDGGVSDFYRWDGAPPAVGKVLRQEELPAMPWIRGIGSARRILYGSASGIDGRPIAVSGLLFLPRGAPPEGGWPLLSWAHGTVGVADRCAPSWVLRGITSVGDWLAAGYAVVASDYEGLGTPGLHPYLDKRAEGQGVLDAARAAIAAEPGRIANRVVIAGQSQGGGAALAAAGLAPSYAPDLAVAAVIATGAPYMRAGALQATGVPPDFPDPGLAYAFYVALTARLHAPDLDPATLFTEAAQPLAARAAGLCVLELAAQVMDAGLTRSAALRPGAEARVEARILPRLEYPSLRFAMPVFMGIGEADRDVAALGQLALLRDACAAGSRMQGRLYAGMDHGGAFRASRRDALDFAARALQAATVDPECDPAATPPGGPPP
ncbi:lipase family protein [Roseomonas sp. 18066]|uniref:lipase family protein n=1 Tax=Roseomonas sp. 18066 TaxID=2681412 RepID=UPI001356DD7C|nr:lipase family protein [Roseomonas sp. 18066]